MVFTISILATPDCLGEPTKQRENEKDFNFQLEEQKENQKVSVVAISNSYLEGTND